MSCSASADISAFHGGISSPELVFMKFVRTYFSWEPLLFSALDKSWSMSSQVSRKRKSYCTFGLISLGTRNSTHFCVTIETSAFKRWPASARFGRKLSNDNYGFSWLVIMHKGIKNLITTETAWGDSPTRLDVVLLCLIAMRAQRDTPGSSCEESKRGLCSV